jgi:ribose transport system ATP-binding protein
MEEILRVSDRVAVMHEGRLAGILAGSERSESNIMTLAVGRALLSSADSVRRRVD